MMQELLTLAHMTLAAFLLPGFGLRRSILEKQTGNPMLLSCPCSTLFTVWPCGGRLRSAWANLTPKSLQLSILGLLLNLLGSAWNTGYGI